MCGSRRLFRQTGLQKNRYIILPYMYFFIKLLSSPDFLVTGSITYISFSFLQDGEVGQRMNALIATKKTHSFPINITHVIAVNE